MFSVAEKKHIADVVEKALLRLKHPEMPTTMPKFTLRVEGKESWSWAEIVPNWTFTENKHPDINPFNEIARQVLPPQIQTERKTNDYH